MRIFVRHLPEGTSEKDLRSLFIPYGLVTSARVMPESMPWSGEVEMPIAKEAAFAIAALDGLYYCGYILAVRGG